MTWSLKYWVRRKAQNVVYWCRSGYRWWNPNVTSPEEKGDQVGSHLVWAKSVEAQGGAGASLHVALSSSGVSLSVPCPPYPTSQVKSSLMLIPEQDTVRTGLEYCDYSTWNHRGICSFQKPDSESTIKSISYTFVIFPYRSILRRKPSDFPLQRKINREKEHWKTNPNNEIVK